MRDIQQYVDRLAEAFRPERIILFGSHAYGTASEDSDVDLLVVMPDDGDPLGKAMEVRQRIDNRFPLDLLVRSREDLRWRLEHHDWLLTDAIERGRVLYESDHR